MSTHTHDDRICIRCGAPGLVGDTASGIWACETCMMDAAAITNGADWAPPAYLLAILTRETQDWRGVSMLRRTAALRAVETANALLYAAEQLIDPRTDADRAQRLAKRVTSTHLHDSGYKELERVARLKIIEYVENCWQDARLIDGSLKTLAIFFPEFPVDERLFRQAIDAWKEADYLPNNPEGPGMWEALCELLRLPGPKHWNATEPPIAAERRRWRKPESFNNYNGRTAVLHPDLAAELKSEFGSGRGSLCIRTGVIERLENHEIGALMMGDEPKFLHAMQTIYAELVETRRQASFAAYDAKRVAAGRARSPPKPRISMEEATRHLERPTPLPRGPSGGDVSSAGRGQDDDNSANR